jgi:hypothetical protein
MHLRRTLSANIISQRILDCEQCIIALATHQRWDIASNAISFCKGNQSSPKSLKRTRTCRVFEYWNFVRLNQLFYWWWGIATQGKWSAWRIKSLWTIVVVRYDPKRCGFRRRSVWDYWQRNECSGKVSIIYGWKTNVDCSAWLAGAREIQSFELLLNMRSSEYVWTLVRFGSWYSLHWSYQRC